MDINTSEVLDAASTKWNFLNFSPGLVGGHCIGVDPYYLTRKAKELNYNSKIILAGRKLNDSMSNFVFFKINDWFSERELNEKKKKILFMGVTFKENCSDIRNSKVFDVISLFLKIIGLLMYMILML